MSRKAASSIACVRYGDGSWRRFLDPRESLVPEDVDADPLPSERLREKDAPPCQIDVHLAELRVTLHIGLETQVAVRVDVGRIDRAYAHLVEIG